MSAMVLPRTRRRRAAQKQQRTEEQASTVTAQLLQVGEIIGRLNTVASRLEAAANRITDDNGGIPRGKGV